MLANIKISGAYREIGCPSVKVRRPSSRASISVSSSIWIEIQGFYVGRAYGTLKWIREGYWLNEY